MFCLEMTWTKLTYIVHTIYTIVELILIIGFTFEDQTEQEIKEFTPKKWTLVHKINSFRDDLI